MSLFVSFRTVMVPLGMLLGVFAATLTGAGHLWFVTTVVLALGMVSIRGPYEALFFSHGDPDSVVGLTAASSALVMLGAATWVTLAGTTFHFAVAYATATTMATMCWAYQARRKHGVVPKPKWNARELIREFRESSPIGLSMLLAVAALKMPIIVLSVFAPNRDVGAYAAAEMFVNAGAVLQVAVTNVTYPRLAASHGHDPALFRRTFWSSNAILAAAGIGVATFLAFWGHRVAGLFFSGREFADLGQLLRVMGWSFPFLLLAHHNIYSFAAANRQRKNVILMVGWFVSLTGAQLVLVPRYGTIGAAWGLLTGRAVGFLLVAIMCFRDVRSLALGPAQSVANRMD